MENCMQTRFQGRLNDLVVEVGSIVGMLECRRSELLLSGEREVLVVVKYTIARARPAPLRRSGRTQLNGPITPVAVHIRAFP